LKNKTIALALAGILGFGSLSSAATLAPTFNLVRQTTGYRTSEMVKEQVAFNTIEAKLTANRILSQIEDLEDLDDKGFVKFGMEQEVPLRISLMTAQGSLNHSVAVMNLTHQNTTYAVYLGLRDLYMGLFRAYEDYRIKGETLALKEASYALDQEKYRLGRIPEVDLMAAEVEMREAGVARIEALNQYRTMLETFNQFIHNDDPYEEYTYTLEEPRLMTLEPVDFYVARALANRVEMVDVLGRVALENDKKTYYESEDGRFLRSEVLTEDYEDQLDEVFKVMVELEQTREAITLEILKAYDQVLIARGDVLSLQATLAEQEGRLENLKLQQDLGYVTQTTYQEVALSIENLRMNYHLAVMSYNSTLYRFLFASSTGPAY
jgi:hypothetical protein